MGVNHQSNGQFEPLSRSWNRIVANVGLERGPLSILLEGWVRLTNVDYDNPGLTHDMGCGESLLDYDHHVHRIEIGFILADWH